MAVGDMRVSLLSGHGAEPQTACNTFRQRCASALTHPTTIAALAVLLLNDLVFKAMWHNPWTTGKFSDLTWVVFASPLLAFLLSFPAGRSRSGQRAAFLASYAGLPLLYAAYNTFGPVHDFVLQALSVASGGIAGSPLDATDSLVIPLGLGIALWVWQRGSVSAESLRVRGALLMAGVAALASVATSYPDPHLGVTNVSPAADGTVIAEVSSEYRDDYWSEDGGRDWQVWLEGVRFAFEPVATQVNTGQGIYIIEGPDVYLLRAGVSQELVYSTRHMATSANVWVQEHATGHLGARDITTEPRSIAYDPSSGNVILSMGIQGVIVGAPDGTWKEHAVGPYSPVDYSFSGKTGLMLSRASFWVMALAIALSVIGSSLLLSQFHRGDMSWLAPGALASVVVLIVVGLGMALGGVVISLFVLALAGGAIALRFWMKERRLKTGVWLPIVGVIALGALLLTAEFGSLLIFLLALAGGAIALGFMPRESRIRRGIGLAAAVLAILSSGAVLVTFGRSDADPSSNYVLALIAFSIPAYLFGLTLLAIAGRELRYWRVVIPTFLGMVGLIIMVFMLWLHLGISLGLAQASAGILTVLAGLLLAAHIQRNTRPAGAEQAQ